MELLFAAAFSVCKTLYSSKHIHHIEVIDYAPVQVRFQLSIAESNNLEKGINYQSHYWDGSVFMFQFHRPRRAS